MMIADSDSEVVSYLRDRVLLLLQQLLRAREAAAARRRQYVREHVQPQYVNPIDRALRRHHSSFGAVNSPAQLEALAYRYFVGRFGGIVTALRRTTATAGRSYRVVVGRLLPLLLPPSIQLPR